MTGRQMLSPQAGLRFNADEKNRIVPVLRGAQPSTRTAPRRPSKPSFHEARMLVETRLQTIARRWDELIRPGTRIRIGSPDHAGARARCASVEARWVAPAVSRGSRMEDG